MDQMKQGQYPQCVQETLIQGKPFVAYEDVSHHEGCVLSTSFSGKGCLASRLEHEDKVYGAMWVTALPEMVLDKEEQSLFLELVADLSYALSGIETENMRTQAEERTRQVKERLQLQIARMPIGLIVWDTEFRVQSWNPAAQNIFGFTAQEALGNHPYDLIVPKEAQPLVDDIWCRLLEGDMTAHSTNENITKDGRTIFCEWTNTPLRESDGKVVGILSMVKDVTERKEAEEEVKRFLDKEAQSAKEWQETFDAITDVITVISPSHEILKINKAGIEALGKKPEEITGKKCYELVHGLDGPIDGCPCAETITTKKGGSGEITDRGRYYIVTAYPILDESGEMESFVHIAKDITESKKMREQLMAQDRLASIGQLVSGVAHEINNPLTGVIGFSELLLKRDLPDDVKADLKIVNDEANRTSTIVKNLLTFARKQPEGKSPVDINEQIQRVLGLREHEQKVSNIQVDTHFASDLPQVMGNSSQLQQVFFNIVINAEFFMLEAHQKGNLTITTERTGDIVRCSFVDDGPGISEENMRNLFTPFHTTKEVGKDTGLGLSICYGIITEHGGRIYAESELGKGATFIIELPISTADKEEP